MNRLPISAALLVAAGCVPAPKPAPAPAAAVDEPVLDTKLVDEIVAAAATQVRRCYRAPRVTQAGRQIVTRIALRMNPDGTLAALPQVVSQSGITPDNRVYAARMAEAASLAVIRCAPLRLPPEHYGAIWQQFDLVFSPGAVA